MLPAKQPSTNAHPFFIHWLILSLALLALGVAIGYSIVHEYKRTDVVEQERLMTQAKVVDVNMERDLVMIGTALVSIIKDLPYLKEQKNSKTLIISRLQALSNSLPGVRTLNVTDAAGKVSFSNREQLIGLNFGEREYFQTARQGGNPAMLYLSKPFKTTLGVYSITMVRVVLDAQGGFSGIVSATLDPEYCSVLLDSVRYSPGMRASLIHGDGKIIVEAPGRMDLAGMDLAKPGSRYTLHKESGREANIFTTGRAFTTGDYRMSAWRTIQPSSLLMDKPLMVTVNRDMQGIFASWRRDASRQGGLFASLFLVAVCGLYLYQRRQQKFQLLETGYTNEIIESEERFRKLADATWEGIIIQREGIILDANESAVKMFGYPAKEIIGIRILELFAPESMEAASQKLAESIAAPLIPQMYLEAVGLRKDKTVFPIELLGKPIRYNNIDARVIAVRDITERKRSREVLEKSEQKYRLLVENTSEAIVVVQDGRARFINRGIEWAGYTPEEYMSMPVMETVHPEDRKEVEQRYLKKISGEATPTRHTYRGLDKSGRIHWIEVSSVLIDWEGRPATLNMITNISERKRAEEEKLRNQERAERLAEEMAIIAEIGRVVGSTLDLNLVYEQVAAETRKLISYDRFMVNRKIMPDSRFLVAYVSGMDNPNRRKGSIYPGQGSATGMVMKTRTSMLIQPADAEEIKDLYPNLYENFKAGLRSTICVPLISMDEVIGSMNFRSEKLKAYTEKDLLLAERIGMQVAGAIANAQIFQDLRETEKSMRESEEHFRAIFERSTIGKSLTAPDGKLVQINKAFADILGYTIEEMSQINFAQITHPDDVAESRECIRILLAGEQKVYRMEKRYIHKRGDIVWANVSTTLFRDELGTPLHLITSIVDITDRKRTEKQLQDTLDGLRKAVGVTIQVLASAVETRDPYTFGHQTRSANLARTIAMEMGLPQDKIEGIRMAASIHDIGKLSIPAEILSKPTMLSAIQLLLIKEHANRGYEMLKDVVSPWPLAEIVRQHHERIDGSGYPRNLKGDDILIEARILSVADVVEAMASHRPYRAGLGIDAALNEIEKNRGIYYDETVVAACLKLFREKGFKLEGT